MQTLWKTPWRLLKKLTTEMSYVPAIPLLGVNRKKMTSLSQKDVCTSMFTAALFTIIKTQLVMDREGSQVCCSPWGCKDLDTTELNWRHINNLRVPWWMNGHTHTHTTGWYLVIKKKILPTVTTWAGPWWHYSKQNKTEKDKYCIFLLICGV